MTLRETMLAAMAYGGPPHVPYEPHLPWEYLQGIHSEDALAPLRDAEKRAPVYIQTIMPGPPTGWKPSSNLPAGHMETEWGAVGRMHLPYITYSPLAGGWHLLEDYRFPDPHAPGRFNGLQELAEQHRRTKYLRGWAFSALWEQVWMLRGYENALLDLYAYPDEFTRLCEHIVTYQVGMMEQFHLVGVDGIHFTDDLGTQQDLMMPPEAWRQLLKPHYARIFEAARANGTDVWFHSDGNIRSIIEDLLDVGVKVLNPIQPGPLDIDELVATFGRRLRYSGGIDVQQLLPFGTPEEVRAAVQHWCGLSRSLGGGMFIAPTNLITPETPLPNILAYLDACAEYC